MIKHIQIYLLSYLLVIVTSCSDKTGSGLHDANESPAEGLSLNNDFSIDGLIIEENKPSVDIENLLSNGKMAKAIDVSGATDRAQDKISNEKNNNSSGNNISNKDLGAETVINDLEVNSLERSELTENLRKINQTKDQTIASLKNINDQLVAEIKRFRGESSKISLSPSLSSGSSSTQLGSLKSEIIKLKNNLALKSEELKNLRYRNDSLEGRISDLELFPNSNKNNLLPRISTVLNTKSTAARFVNQSSAGQCNLQFEAVVTALNGKSKEAFYTEFFILPENLENIIRNGGIELKDYPEIDTYSELWARSRKNAFLYPDVHKKFRSLLLDLEAEGEGRRVRTDVDGAASVDGLEKGKYYVIGTASLGKVGVTWSVPISLNGGNNKISLTLANCSWSL